jgi:hypothetical protein
MLVKIHSRGGGGGSGPTGYLMSTHDHAGVERSVSPEVLRGDVSHTRELIDSLAFSRRYTSGCLSFSEANIPLKQKQEVMDHFEECLFPGLEKDQYQVLWIEHRDKGRLELNFVISNVELSEGKRLQPYYDKADRLRVDSWQTLINDRFSLSDPHDPERARALTVPANLPKKRVEAITSITEGLLRLEPQNRAEVLLALNGAGFDVVRETKKSISIADPEGGRNLRLSGGIYDESYRGGEELCREREKAERAYRSGREARVQEAQRCYKKGIGIRRSYLQKRHERPTLQDRHLADVQHDSDSRRLRARGSANVRAHERGQVQNGGHIHERAGGVDTMPRTRQKQSILSDRGGEVDDGARASAIESIEKAGRRAGKRTQAHRASTATNQPFGRISRAVERTIDFGRRTVERLTTSVREIGKTITRERS